MKLFISLLLVTAFIQSSIISLDLCLVLIICYALVSDKKSNLIAAFLGGIFLSLLTVQNLGLWSIIFLVVIKIVSFVKKLPLATSVWIFAPTVFLICLGVNFLTMILSGQSIDFLRVILDTFVAVPIYFLLRFWEERFDIKPEIKLRIRN